MIPSVTNSKTTHIPSSIYARDPSSETTNLYRKLRADLTRATQARYDELNTRPMYSGSASSSIWSHSPASLYLSGYKHTSIDNKMTRPSLKATSISTGYYPVFQRALPISMTPSLIANTYDFSPSPTSSDWDARSRTCCSDDSTSDDTSVSDISFPGSPTRPFPTPCPSSPLLGPSTSPTPVTRQSEESDGTWPARFDILPERPDVNTLESLRYLINSLTDLGKRFLENNLAYQTAGTGESSSLDGIMEKAWSGWRSSTSSNSSSSFSFNPVFESSVASSSAREPSSDSFYHASYEQPTVTGSAWAKPGLTAPPPQAQSRAPIKPNTKRNSVSSFSKLDPRTPAYIPQATRTESSHHPRGPLIHNPNALTLFDCSCSDCHWTLLKMNGVTQGDIEKIDDEWGTLKKAAIREGVILPETAPQKDQ